MPSTFLKRFELLRDDFHKKTKQWPQLRMASDGSEKATGIGDDLKKIDAFLNADDGDFGALTSAYQAFEKHARTYTQQIDAKPGAGILSWLKNKGTDIGKDEEKKLVTESKEFGRRLEDLIKDVDATVKSALDKVASRKDQAKVFETLKAETLTWTKYVELEGLRIIMDPKNAEMILNPRTQRPSTDALRVGTEAKQAAIEFVKLIAAVKKLDTSSLLPPMMRRNLTKMREGMDEAGSTAKTLIELLQTWSVEIGTLLKGYETTGTKHEKHNDMLAMMAKVDAAKQSLQKLELKTDTAKKAIDSLLKK